MPAVAGLAAVVAAIVALLICYGALYLGRMLTHFVPRSINLGAASIPFGSLIQDAIDAAMAGIQWIFGQWILPAVAFVARPVIALLGFLSAALRFVTTAATQLAWIVDGALPEVLGVAKGWALAHILQVRAYALGLYRAGLTHALAWVNAARAYAAGLYHDALARISHAYELGKAYTRALVAASAADLARAINSARAEAAGLVRAARSDLGRAIAGVEAQVAAIEGTTVGVVAGAVAQGVATAEAFATTAVAAGIGTLTTDVGAAVADTFDGLITDVGELVDVIGTDLPDIGDLARAIPRTIPTDIAGTIGLSLAVERVAVRFMRDCGVPNCKRLGGLGHLLGDLADAASAGLLIAMLADIVTDPEGAARTAIDDLSGLVHETSDLVTGLLGV